MLEVSRWEREALNSNSTPSTLNLRYNSIQRHEAHARAGASVQLEVYNDQGSLSNVDVHVKPLQVDILSRDFEHRTITTVALVTMQGLSQL